MPTKVKFIGEDDNPTVRLFQKNEPRWEIGDEGVIDGYVCDQYGATYACVILRDIIVSVKLYKLKVI